MTYSDMIFAMDTGINYTTSKRGRKSYKKENEKWDITIQTSYRIISKSEYHKTQEQGEKWVKSVIDEINLSIKRYNKRADKWGFEHEKLELITIEHTDRMNVKTIENVDC